MIPRPSARLQWLAACWILPGLVAAMVTGNQGWMLGPLSLGQVLSWLNDLSAVVLVFGRFPGRRWPLVVLLAALAAKAATIVPSIAARADLGFDVALGVLFLSAGAVVVSERPGLVYKQLLRMAALSIPLMVIQMSGTAAWSETLNTENIAAAGPPRFALFVGEDDLYYRTSQARPSGFTHSNNFLSLIAGFALVLHFSQIKTARLTRRDVLICTFALLTMAKVVLLVYGVIVFWKLITGVRMERHRMMRVIFFTMALLAVYRVVFPGLLANNISLYKIGYSFFIRANDFADLLPPTSTVGRWLRDRLVGTPRADWKGAVTLSGYAQIISLVPYLLAGAALAAPLFVKGLRNVRRRYPEVVDLTVLALFLVVLYPSAVPLFRAQIFAFIAGFGMLPFFTIWEARFFPGSASPRSSGPGSSGPLLPAGATAGAKP